MAFLISLTRIAKPVAELVITTELKQCTGGFLLAPANKTLYSNTHIIIYILLIYAASMGNELDVRLHKCQGILLII